jgi:CubicO group peptidase (beta-lactamase class C family)
VLVSQGDEVLLEAAYGMANLEHRIPVATNTVFRIGSITKQFTAVAILLLEQDGLLRLEDTLAKFLPEYPRGAEITLRHLLSHTSGIVNSTALPDFWARTRLALTQEEVVASYRDLPLDFEPGSEWRYSNSGYYLLGMVIEKASGMTYEEFMQSRVFSPLGLDDTGYDRSERILKRRAAGYDRPDGQYINAPFLDMSQPLAAGALYSTVGDLHAWTRAIMHGQFISVEALERATTRGVLADGSETRYGFGWGLLDSRGLRAIAHGGAIHGFNSFMAYYPAIDATVVVLANFLANSNVDSNRVAVEVKEIHFHSELEARER